MARYGVSITKQCSFRNSTQEFSNVYYYEALNLPNQSDADTIINNLTSLEKTFHSSGVTFVRGRLWSQVGSPSQNNMILQKNLSGVGAGAAVSGFDKERAYLVRLRAGNDSRGNPVYLRKWYHSCGTFGPSVTPGTGALDNTTGLTVANRDNIVLAMQAIGDANGSPGSPKLCAKSGRLPDAGATWFAHAYLEHRQLGDMWRAQ